MNKEYKLAFTLINKPPNYLVEKFSETLSQIIGNDFQKIESNMGIFFEVPADNYFKVVEEIKKVSHVYLPHLLWFTNDDREAHIKLSPLFRVERHGTQPHMIKRF